MSGQPDRFKDVSAWIKIAEDDFRTAESLLFTEDPAFGIICFPAQQCAEKYLKALLVWLQVDFPKTHDLVLLARLMPEDVVLSMNVAQWAFLNRCSVEPRYPGEWGSFSKEDAEEALTICRAVREEIRLRLPAETST